MTGCPADKTHALENYIGHPEIKWCASCVRTYYVSELTEYRIWKGPHLLSDPEPPPKTTDIAIRPAIWDLVVEDMKERDKMGEQKYGVRLRANDGRKSLIDAYQEALDLVVYLRKAIYEIHGK